MVGALQGPPLQVLLEIVGGGSLVLDLSDVQEADLDVVRMLARLPSDRFRLVGSPKWLGLGIASDRRTAAEPDAEALDERELPHA